MSKGVGRGMPHTNEQWLRRAVKAERRLAEKVGHGVADPPLAEAVGSLLCAAHVRKAPDVARAFIHQCRCKRIASHNAGKGVP